MSVSSTMEFAEPSHGTDEATGALRTEFRIVETQGCRLIYGKIPLRSAKTMLSGMSRNAVMDTDAARMFEATFVVGKKRDLDVLKNSARAAAIARVRHACAANGLSEAAIEWLAIGQQGRSSVSLFWLLSGVRPRSEAADLKDVLPLDLSDFMRCRRMLEEVPDLAEAMTPSIGVEGWPRWSWMLGGWGALCATMDLESPQWRQHVGKAPIAGEMLEALRLDAEARAKEGSAVQ